MHSKVTVLDGVPSLAVVVHDGNIYQAVAGFHPNFNMIFQALEDNPRDESVIPLFDIEKTLNNELSKILSERVSVRNGEVLFDGDPLNNGVAKQILRFVEEGLTDRLTAVVAFTEKVMTNPQEHSRDQLFNWLARFDFTITEEGDIVGYKGCNVGNNESPVSSRPAPEKDGVIRNGEAVVNEYVKNLDGDVIEMPRSKVDFNAGVGCSVGLHVGTYAYAKSFAPVLLEVHVNPRDVVSVPVDCGEQKMRVCRYTVVGAIEDEYTSAVLPRAQVFEPVKDTDDEFSDLCSGCGEDLYEGESGFCEECVEDNEDEAEESLTDALDNLVAAAEAVRDTRLNHAAQKRYPPGTYIDGKAMGGRFIPKV